MLIQLLLPLVLQVYASSEGPTSQAVTIRPYEGPREEIHNEEGVRLIFDLVDAQGDPSTDGSGYLTAKLAGHDQPAGTVCDDSFTHEAATVICKEMGYTCAEYFGSGESSTFLRDLPIALDNVECSNVTLPFSHCTWSSDHNCAHSEDIYLGCDRLCDYSFKLVDRNGNVTNNSTGLLLATKLGTDKVGTVCDDSFNYFSAQLICRSMNFSCAASVRQMPVPDWPIQQQVDILLDDVACSSSTGRFRDSCTWISVNNCNHNEDVFLDCSCLSDRYKFSMIRADGSANTAGEGLLIATQQQVPVGQEPLKGTVCDDNFEDSSANWLCKDMGYNCSVYWGNVPSEAYVQTQDKYPVLLDNVVCRAASEDPCTFTHEPNCEHSEDIYIYCGNETKCAKPLIQFKTVGIDGATTSNGSGLLIASRPFIKESEGTVCDDNFNSKAANLICQRMGYTCNLGWNPGSLYEIQASYDIVLDNIMCGSSNTSFDDCSYSHQHNCGHSEDIFISCANDCTYEFKLIDGDGVPTTNGSGLLIALRGQQQSNGTVCDDNFSDTSGDVICKMMGFTCQILWLSQQKYDYQEDLTIILDNIQCLEGAQEFSDCSFNSGSHNCAHREDVHLICSDTCGAERITFKMLNSDGQVDDTGRGLLIAVKQISPEFDISGTVCDDDFTTLEAAVICRELGYQCARLSSSGHMWVELQNKYSIILDNVDCSAAGENGTFNDNCTYVTSHNCGHSEDIFLACGRSEEECTTKEGVRFALVNEAGEESENGAGLLIATTIRSIGTVCDDGFNMTAADAICKEIGYQCAHWWKYGALWEVQQTYDIALDNVECSTNNFTECSYFISHNCGHQEDVFLQCSNRCLKSSSYRTKLVDMAGDTTLSGEGLLLMQAEDDDLTGTICGNGFSHTDAEAVCKALGFSCMVSATTPELGGFDPWPIQGTYETLMQISNCSQNENNLTKCSYNLSHDCLEDIHDLHLSCGGLQNLARISDVHQNRSHPDGGPKKVRDADNSGKDFFEDPLEGAYINMTWPITVTVHQIVIYNRGDDNKENIEGVTIEVAGVVIQTISLQIDGGTNEKYVFSGMNIETRYLVVRGNSHGLALAGMVVYGPPSSMARGCSMEFKLIADDGADSTTGSGLLIANRAGSPEKGGTICDDFFSDQSANVICKEIGYECASGWHNGENWEVQNEYVVLMDDVQCPDGSLDFSNCTYNMRDHNCQHSEDVFVSCETGLEDLGCWADSENKAIPSLEGGLPDSSSHWRERPDPVGVCRDATMARGWTVFAITLGGSCSSSADASETYNQYGRSGACVDERGGLWANSVYIVEIEIGDEGATSTTLIYLGCWRDSVTHAIPSLEREGQHPQLDGDPVYRANAIEQCKKAAQDSGFSVFAVKGSGYCMSGVNASDTYQKYGESEDCDSTFKQGSVHNINGWYSNQVYKIREDPCSGAEQTFKFYFVDEKGNRAEKSGLLIAEGKAGSGDLPGTVCDDHFNETAGTVICREMGFQCSTGWTKKNWDDIQKRYSIVLDDIHCPSQNISFQECSFKTTSNCGHSEDVFLGCDDTCLPPKYTFSLVNAETGENSTSVGKGLVIASKNGTAAKGTICDDEFNEIAANILCKEMGFVCAKGHFVTRPSTDYQETLNILLDNIKCTNQSESFSKSCTYVTGHNCMHSEDIFLICKNSIEECEAKEIYSFYLVDKNLERTYSGSGLLLANKTEGGKVGTVCDDKFNGTSATIICNEMGYNCATAWFNAHDFNGAQANLTTVLDNIECGESAKRFTDCSYQFHHDCSHNEDVYLICQNRCKGHPFAFYQVDEDGHQSINGSGLLLVHTFKSLEGATSGTVCGDLFNDAAAAVICQQMGHDHAIRWKKDDKAGIQMMYPPIMNNVTCNSTDDDFSTGCSYVFDHECTVDIYLECEAESYPQYFCPPGSQYEDNQCNECARNTYKALYSADPCVACPEGSVSVPGSTVCRPCPTLIEGAQCVCGAGQVFDFKAGACVACPANTYITSNLWEQCRTCPLGSDSAPGSAECSCPAGSKWDTKTKTCTKCAAGTFSFKGSKLCDPCGDVPTSPDQSSCVCEPGNYWSLQIGICNPCLATYYANKTGAMECNKCPKYTTSPMGAAECVLCGEGQYWTEYVCKDCPKGQYGNKIECISISEDNVLANAVRNTSGSGGNTWIWPLLVACVIFVACIILGYFVIHYRKRADRARHVPIQWETQMDDFTVTENVTINDNVLLLPAEI